MINDILSFVEVEGAEQGGGPGKRWKEDVDKDMNDLLLTPSDAMDRCRQREMSRGIGIGMVILWAECKQASKFIRQKQYYDNINTKRKQYNGRLPEGNPSIELVAYSKI